MKKMKKLASLLLAVLMVLSMTVAAFADDETTEKGDNGYTITLTGKYSGHTYTAYQIFKGDLLVENKGTTTEKKTLSNIEWANNVDLGKTITEGEETLGLIAVINRALGTNLADTASARNVAEALDDNNNDSEVAQKFVKAIRPFLNKDNAVGTASSGTGTKITTSDGEERFEYKISGLEAGYYLVEDTAISSTEGDAYSRYIMEVVADVNANVKAETPEIVKKILTGENRVDANVAGIGKRVTYEISGKVPDCQSYDKYYYIINDTLSAGLTFNNDIVVTLSKGTTVTTLTGKNITDDDNQADSSAQYYVYTSIANDGKTTFQVAFANIKDFDVEATKGADIKVTYSATVNEKAVVGGTGNDNKASLTYSNNPNKSEAGDGEPGKPDPSKGHVTGTTPDDITLTYLAKVNIVKTFKDSNGNVITVNRPNAEFTITGTSKETLLTGKTYYEKDAAGTYYLLQDGTYTTKLPIEEGAVDNDNNPIPSTSDDYAKDENGNYQKYTPKTTTKIEEKDSDVWMRKTTDANGNLEFEKLGEGTYRIEETNVPAGYNKAPIVTVVIKAELPTVQDKDGNSVITVQYGTEKAVWVNTSNPDNVTLVKDANDTEGMTGSYSATYQAGIENNAGSILPSTGGIGTTIFYAAGIILMAGAVFFVVRRKKA